MRAAFWPANYWQPPGVEAAPAAVKTAVLLVSGKKTVLESKLTGSVKTAPHEGGFFRKPWSDINIELHYKHSCGIRAIKGSKRGGVSR